MKILTINPGSTSSKIALFEDKGVVFEKTVRHSAEELAPYPKIIDQYQFRKKMIVEILKENGIDIKDLDAVVGRGGLLKPIEGGVYRVNQPLLDDLKAELMGEHASNLGGILAYELALECKNSENSFIVDPVVVDEMDDIARISGVPELKRLSIFHALNQKAVARRFAKERGKHYNDFNLIVAHMGGGISIGAHRKGAVIDVNNALDGDGPFSPERSGGVPAGQLAKLCFSGKYTLAEIKKKLKGSGGLVAYLGTNNAQEAEKRAIDGDKEAKLIYKAMAYQVSKDIGALSTVLKGEVDGIILTGGVAYNKLFCGWIEERVSHIGKVYKYPGEDEMQALAEGGYYALTGEMKIKEYK